MEYLSELMLEKVELCKDEYVEGNKYFHAMDDLIKYDQRILQELLDETMGNEVLILSGAFGHQMVFYLSEIKSSKPYILLVGSPRKNEDVSIYAIDIYGLGRDFTKAVFIDDTYYSGRTHFYCKGFIESKFGLKMNRALVAYDGRKYDFGQVDSLYRYFNHHDFNGNPLD